MYFQRAVDYAPIEQKKELIKLGDEYRQGKEKFFKKFDEQAEKRKAEEKERLEKEKAEELLKKYNADGLFVDDSDHVWMTEGMKERFQLLKDTYSISEQAYLI